MSYVELEGVTKFFGETRALDIERLAIEEGEFFALVGPSGSGKTTLLRLVAGFAEPTSGIILIMGNTVQHLPPYKRDIGMVFQNYALFPHMSVYENIAFGLKVRHLPQSETESRVKALLELVRLPGMEDRRPQQLSGGQQQRVALARALATQPRLLLLDEPLGALDKKLRTAMQVELRQIQREVGITTVFVTHDQEEALTLSDRIAVINEGRIVQLGPPAEVYERPATRFVADFLGQSNFISGNLISHEAGRLSVRTPTGLQVFARSDRDLPANASVTLAVRPEKIRLSTGEPSGANAFEAEIVHIVYLGTSITYHLELFDGTPLIAFDRNEGAGHTHAVGTRVVAAWDEESSLVMQDEHPVHRD